MHGLLNPFRMDSVVDIEILVTRHQKLKERCRKSLENHSLFLCSVLD